MGLSHLDEGMTTVSAIFPPPLKHPGCPASVQSSGLGYSRSVASWRRRSRSMALIPVVRACCTKDGTQVVIGKLGNTEQRREMYVWAPSRHGGVGHQLQQALA